MENVCPKCHAYMVTPETRDLPLKKQPYFNDSIDAMVRKGKKKRGDEKLAAKNVKESKT